MSAPFVPATFVSAPDNLSVDGVRMSSADHEILKDLSTLDLTEYFQGCGKEAKNIMRKVITMSKSLMTNPRVPIVDTGNLERQIATLQEELNRERANSAALSTRRPSTPPAIQAERISDPEKFTGDREKLRTFKTHLLMKLQGDASRFPNTQHQLLYAIGRLSGSALAQVETYIKPDGVHLEGVGKLLDVLDMAFGDPDSEATAK